MKHKFLGIVIASFLAFTALAQSRPNPDAPTTQPTAPAPPPQKPQEDGPMRVLDAPPRPAEARQEQPPSWKDRLRLGGSFALTLGTFTNIEVAPAAGLQLTDRLAVGGSVVYRYISNRDFWSRQRVSDNFYGGRAFAFFNILENINLNAELETLNVSYLDVLGNPVNRRTNLNSFLAGGSYSTPLGGRFIRSASIVLLYNFSFNRHVNPTQPTNNIYPSGSPFVIRFLFF